MSRFPAGFLWGSATAAHQVEGGNHGNDWWDWEQVPAHIKNGDSSDPACDHYERFASDFDMLRRLHQNAHRLSVEWSRIEPAPGEFSSEALGHYRDVLEALKARDIEPMITLHHFTNPRWIAASGGWEATETADRFARFAEKVTDELSGLARLWITINEPTVIAYQGYVKGEWPPGKQSLGAAARSLVTMLRGHWMAYERVKARHPELQLGLAHHLRVFDPARRWVPLDRLVAAAFERLFNVTMLASLRRGRLAFPLTRAGRASGPPTSQDFIGVNYYTRELVRFNRRYGAEMFGERVPAPRDRCSELGWEIYPEGLYRTLRKLQRERLPIYVTENGIADKTDAKRPDFVRDHIEAMGRAIDDGVPVRGYFHWTSFDNFEWAEGYSAKFGLIACDPVTQTRRLRPSAELYSEICRSGKIPASAELPPVPRDRAVSGGQGFG